MLDEIKERLNDVEKRNPGAWLIVDRGGMGYDVDPLESGMRGMVQWREDALFIAQTPRDIAWLIAEIERLNAANEQLRQKNDELWRMVGDRTGNA